VAYVVHLYLSRAAYLALVSQTSETGYRRRSTLGRRASAYFCSPFGQRPPFRGLGSDFKKFVYQSINIEACLIAFHSYGQDNFESTHSIQPNMKFVGNPVLLATVFAAGKVARAMDFPVICMSAPVVPLYPGLAVAAR
jgi:hypothetical protein